MILFSSKSLSKKTKKGWDDTQKKQSARQRALAKFDEGDIVLHNGKRGKIDEIVRSLGTVYVRFPRVRISRSVNPLELKLVKKAGG